MILTRRELLQNLTLAGTACTLGVPHIACAQPGADADWQWLYGTWDVHHERLRDRLVGSSTWDEFGGKCSCAPALGGLGNVDDCLLYLPSGTYRAFAPRAFDPATRTWNIWWLDGRVAGKLDPPVRGTFAGMEGEFLGNDVHKGTPVTVRFRWHETRSARPWWDQAFSADDGKSWEINWRNYFTKTQAEPTSIPLGDGETVGEEAADWAFIAGRWQVQNQKLAPDGSWTKFASTLHNRPVMAGYGNVGDNLFEMPGGAYRGMSMRAFDPKTRLWRSWWLDGRSPSDIGPAVSGRFERGTGTLIGEDMVNGEKVQVRSQWSKITKSSAHWEQALSRDGKRWRTNWVADMERVAG
ncbi:MAG TPA: hypothetical protein VF033_16070 [Steroidobacteraceae bacterium]